MKSNYKNIFSRDSSLLGAAAALFLSVFLTACGTASQNTGVSSQSNEPVIDVSPVHQGDGSWKIADADSVNFTVRAPEAKSIRLLYRPVVETDRHIVLKTIKAPQKGAFTASVKLVADFAGDVWAEASYADGSTKETAPLQLGARNSEAAQASAQSPPAASPSNSNSNSARTTDDARSDRVTGGKIEKSSVQSGRDIKITVNVPAFQMTVWQDGKEIKTYEIGVGMKKYPIVIDDRQIKDVIWNPEWVPPDSEWVNESHADVEPGEHVQPGDPRNPLGKIKIPLGDGFLMHQARGPSDIGHLVSHGCIRMLQEDILDLANIIVASRSLSITPDQIQHAMKSTDRLSARINPPISADIRYDTIVVEGGVLHIYPDVYDRGTNTVENLRAELQSVGFDALHLDPGVLQQMLARPNANEQFTVSLADLKSGNALVAGTTQPLTSHSVVAKKAAPATKRRGARGRR